MTDSSNHLKHHSQMSKKISKKQAFRNNLISNGINTHEEEKMEISNRDEKMVQQEENKKNRNNDGLIESDSESEEQKEINLEEIKKSKNILEKNQDKIAEISHYLILKNKINAKNAFDIPMLNVKEMSDFNKIEGEFAWKNLSSALEAGAKIYGFRVDSVHSETYKILGGLNRTELDEMNKQLEGDNNQSNQNEVRVEENIRRKHDSNDSNTLERNLGNINTTKYDLEFDVDPLFSKTSAKFDESGSKGLLLNNISVNHNLELLFDIQHSAKKEILESNKEKAKKYTSLNDLGLVGQMIGRVIFDLQVCPEISAFKEEIKNDEKIFSTSKYFSTHDSMFGSLENDGAGIDKAFQDMNIFVESFVISDENLIDMDFPESNPEPNNIEENYDNHMNMVANEYMNFDSNISLNPNTTFENTKPDGLFNNNANITNNMANINNMTYDPTKFNLNYIQEKTITIGTGRSFNFTDIASTKWMGPDQWKIKMNLSKQSKILTKEGKEGGNEGTKKDKSNKVAKPIEFNLSIKENINNVFNVSTKKTQVSNTLGKNQESQPLKQSFLLPIDCHINVNRLGSTFLRDPSSVIINLDNEDPNNNYPNNDDHRIENEDIIGEDDVVLVDNEGKPQQEKTKSHKGQIPIKELKEKIWNKMIMLKGFKQEENEMNIEDDGPHGYSFGSIVNMLPEIVGESDSKKVTVQTCFVTILHLANEKILKLNTLHNQKNDFLIEMEKVH